MARLSRRPLFRQRRSLASRFAGGATVVLIAAVAILGVIYLMLPWTSGLALRAFLNQHGWGPVKLHVAQFNLRSVEIRDLQIAGGAVTLADVHITYTPRDLWLGQVGEIAVKGLAVTATVTEADVTIGTRPLPVLPASSSQTIPFRHLTVADSKIVIALPQNRIETSVSADLTPANGRWKGAVTAEASALQGDVNKERPTGRLARIVWQGELAWPDVTDAASSGTLDLNAEAVALMKDAKLSGHGQVAFVTGGSQLSLTSPNRIAVSLSAFPVKDGAWGKFLGGGIALEVGGGKGGPSITWHADSGISTAEADVDFSAVLGEASLRGALHGKTGGKIGEIPDTIAIDELRLEGNHVPSPFGDLSGRARISDVSGPLMTAQGAARLEATLTKPVFGPASAASLIVNADARFHIDGATIAFTPQTLTVTATDLRAGALIAPGATALTLSPAKSETQTLGVVLGVTGEPTLTFGIATAVQGLRMATDPQGVNAATIDVPRLRFDGYAVPVSGLYDVSIHTTGGTISYPAADFKLDPLSARFLPSRGEGSGEAQLTRLFGAPARIPPAPGLIFKYNFQSANQLIDLAADISSAKSQGVGRIKAQLNPGDGSGHFDLDASHLAFGDGALAAEDVFTGAFPISDLSGSVNFSIKTARGAKSTGSARLALDNVAFQSAGLSVSGLATDLYLASLTPLRSPGPQHITAATVTAGLLFKDITLEASLAGDTKATLSGGASVAGGKASFGNIVIPLDDPQATTMPLSLSHLRLETLIAQAQVDGLSASGSISGILPLRSARDTIRVESGQIKSDAPGRVSYQPKSPPAALVGAGEIVLQALSNFEFDSIGASVTGDLLKDLHIGLAMKGRNPDLHGGYPISFNLNLAGPLGNALRGGVTGYRLGPDTIPALDRNAAPSASVNPGQP